MAEFPKSEDGKNPTPAVEDLARRLMDLWQEQVAAVAADPDLMRQMARMMAASPMAPAAQNVLQGMLAALQSPPNPTATPAAFAVPGPNPFDPNQFAANFTTWWNAAHGSNDAPQPTPQPGPKPVPPGPAPAAAASGSRGDDLAELRRHLAGLEARLSELGEAGKRIAQETRGPSKPAKSNPPKPRKSGKSAKPSADPLAGTAAGTGSGKPGGSGEGSAS